jgi:hypothetical protein
VTDVSIADVDTVQILSSPNRSHTQGPGQGPYSSWDLLEINCGSEVPE